MAGSEHPAHAPRPSDRPEDAPVDLGLTHVALPVADLDRSIEFYRAYAGMEVVHRRHEPGGSPVAWISDRTRPFVVVVIECADPHRLGGWSHLGVGLPSRDAVDAAAAKATAEGRAVDGPHDSGPPVGYWVFITDPDGHQLELAHGQEVGLTVERS